MWQTKFFLAVPKNLGLGFDFRPCSEGNFLIRRPWSLSMLQLERGAVTLCSVCALLRNFDKDLHGDPMLLCLLLEVVNCLWSYKLHI